MSQSVWQNSNTANQAVGRGGLYGQSGGMPHSLYLNKMEQTCMYEDENQLDNFFRNTLKDRTSDKASLAQNLPKETQNVIRSEVLNVRHHGARTSAEPIHPDLFLGFTERDPRGYHNSGPDMREYSKQSKARGKFKNFSSDVVSDMTIPEGTRSEARVISDIRRQ